MGLALLLSDREVIAVTAEAAILKTRSAATSQSMVGAQH
jgi:hypothetical protein